MPTAACNGVTLHFERVGHGRRLLYCNGSGTTLDSTRPLLDKLSAQFDLLAFDYRGMGASALVTKPYTTADVAADMAGLLDVIGWDRTALAGWSFGGMVAQEFAVTFPEFRGGWIVRHRLKADQRTSYRLDFVLSHS